jgi:hypothetical protein
VCVFGGAAAQAALRAGSVPPAPTGSPTLTRPACPRSDTPPAAAALRELVAAGADMRDLSDGVVPLFLAAAGGPADCIAVLLSRGAVALQ